MQRIAAEAQTEATPEAVWALLSDRSTWPSWSPLGAHTAERAGRDGTPDDVGGIAEFVTGRHRVREEVVVCERGERLGYRLLSGLALRDYRADVDLVPTGAGTRILWSAAFRPKVPGTGWLYRGALTRMFRGMVDGLAVAARDRGNLRPGA